MSSEEVRVALKEIQSRVAAGGAGGEVGDADAEPGAAPPVEKTVAEPAGVESEGEPRQPEPVAEEKAEPDLGAVAEAVAIAGGAGAAAGLIGGDDGVARASGPETGGKDEEKDKGKGKDEDEEADEAGTESVVPDEVAGVGGEPEPEPLPEPEPEPESEPAVLAGAAAPPPPPPMPTASEVEALTHKDRRLSLALVGVGMIVFAAGWALLVPVVQHFGSLFIQDGAVLEASGSTVPLVWCVFWATVFLLLGFGAIFSRRWARVTTQSVGWFWFLAGAMALGAIWYFYGEVTEWVRPFAGGVPGGAERAMVWGIGVIGVLFVFVPGFLILYFSAPSVRATCRAHDPRVRWTDHRPVGSLIAVWALVALALWAAWCAWAGAPFPLYGRGELTELRASQVWAGIAGGFGLLALANFFPRPWVWIFTVLSLMAVGAAFAVPAYVDFSARRFAAPETTAQKVVVTTLAFWLFVVLGYLGLAGCFGGRKRHEAA